MADLSAQIAKAREAGYSDAEITAHLAKGEMSQKIATAKSAGYSDAQIVKHLTGAAKVNPVVDAAKSLGSGVLTAARDVATNLDVSLTPVGKLGGLRVPDVTRKGVVAASWLLEKTGQEPKGTFERVRDRAYEGSVKQRYDDAGAGYQPQTTPGRYLKVTGSFAPNALNPVAAGRGAAVNALARGAQVVVPAVASEGAADAVNALGGGETAQNVARVVGAIGGGVAASARVRPAARPNADAAAADAMQEIGIDIRVLPEGTRRRAVQLIEDGRTPEEVAMFVAASEGTPVPIPLRRGDMTANPVHQHAENMALRGAYGAEAAGVMQGQVARQQQALRGNVQAFADEFGGGAARPVGQGAAPASERLNEMRGLGEDYVSAAYGAAREAGEGSWLPREQNAILGAQLREAVRDFDMESLPTVARQLGRFDERQNIGVRDLFDVRARLNTLTQSADPIEAGAARTARGALDRFIGEALDSGAIQGEADSVAMWRNAIGARRTVGETFESGDLLEVLTERTMRNGDRRALKVDPGEAANVIFGRAGTGAGKRDLYRDMVRLRDVLGANSGEWNSIRAEAFQRVARAGDGAVEAGERQFSGVKFQKAWQDFLRDDPRLANALFTSDERARISNFARIAARVTNPVKGGDNPSNSAVTALKLLPAFIRNLPFLGQIARGIDVQVKVSSTVRATNPYPSQAPRPSPQITTNRNALAAPAAIGAVNAFNRPSDERR